MGADIRQVARSAGVSPATVSNVLTGTKPVSAETRTRVLNAVRELGYAPNAAARNLVTGRSHLLGLLVSDIRNPFFPEIITAFQDRAGLRAMEAVVMNTNYDARRTADCVGRLRGLQVPGVAVLTSQIEPAIVDELAAAGLCAVYLDLGRVDRRISNIVVDCEAGIEQAVEHLRSLGHTRIGYIGGPPELQSAARRRSTFQAAVTRDSLEHLVVDSDFTVQGGYFACGRLLAGFGASAIVAGNDLMAIGAIHCAWDRGLRLPADLSITGFDDIDFARYTQPALTTVAVPRNSIGAVAFDALTAMLDSEDKAGREYRVETSLVVRQSTAGAAR